MIKSTNRTERSAPVPITISSTFYSMNVFIMSVFFLMRVFMAIFCASDGTNAKFDVNKLSR